MELPGRARGEELLRAGELTDVRSRLRKAAAAHDIATVIACAFDHRTRMLPFIYADTRMIPAGVRAIGSAMVDAGFHKTRIVLQQWNRGFRPSQMRLDGRVPDLFMVSSMRIHSARCEALIRDACGIGRAHRPLIIAGGPKVIYEPWGVFSADPADPWAADVAVTGEEYVLLSLLEVLLATRAGGEPMRSAFLRARDSGALDEIPGLVYARGSRDGVAEELVDTGVQRLLGDLDELPDPVLGYRLLEPPSGGAALRSRALAARGIGRCSPIGSLVLTFGCRFACPYCPIPAYNQRHFRFKSGERIAEEMRRLHGEYGMRYFFGADDNFFDDRPTALKIMETLARTQVKGSALARAVHWATEVTVHDTLAMQEDLPLVAASGVGALWMGVEDMTGALIRKGQSVEKTSEVFRLLRAHGIFPMPMMMHHDAQPLYTRGSPYGLLNQVRLLGKAGAIDVQILMMTPAIGSRHYDEAFASGLVYDSVDGRRVEARMFDGNYVVASQHPQPWRKQLNMLAAYLYFYSPLRLPIALFRTVRPAGSVAAIVIQLMGMWGLVQTIRRTLGWALRLMRGKIKRHTRAPTSRIPMRSADGGPASHAPPGTPRPQYGSPEP
jgi:radical SAM superfamily enzyme YgiQ (UPF0313 family)